MYPLIAPVQVSCSMDQAALINYVAFGMPCFYFELRTTDSVDLWRI
jgi:hypothetical protein